MPSCHPERTREGSAFRASRARCFGVPQHDGGEIMTKHVSRRSMIKTAAGVGIALATRATLAAESAAARKGRINHSACQWCFKSWDKEEFCQNAVKLGMVGIDLLSPDWFPSLKKYNLQSTMTTSHGIPKGLNHKENWEECLTKIRASI